MVRHAQRINQTMRHEAGCRNHFAHLVSDFLVTLCLMMLHALILLCQGMAFSVAMNSKRNHALVGLIIAINFVEMKGGPPRVLTCLLYNHAFDGEKRATQDLKASPMLSTSRTRSDL